MGKSRTLSADRSISEKRLSRIQMFRQMQDDDLLEFIENRRKRVVGMWKELQDAEEEVVVRRKRQRPI